MRLHLFYDGTGLRDYASVGSGAKVVPGLTSETYSIQQPYISWTPWKRDPALQGFPPEVALFADMHVGSCWPMRGWSGSLGIALARPAVVTSFAIDHIPQQLTFRVDIAPRSGQLWGAATVLPTTSHDFAKTLLVYLGDFAFDIHSGDPCQVYNVSENILRQLGDRRFVIAVLVIGNNWGNDDFTCLYRVRIHSDN
ncbi:hypothetical protein OH77DRAFT_1409899 [Trametes cingulata]|nr:hypothetical protein OH77DRAFT_1409899 [Trametes cingulata]